MKTEIITPEVFEKLLDLAALGITPEQSEYLRAELNHQLASVSQLANVPVDDDLPFNSHGILCVGADPREDVVNSYPQPDKIVALAPESEDGMIAVPDVKEAQ
mgnify:CR=1 FL=1